MRPLFSFRPSVRTAERLLTLLGLVTVVACGRGSDNDEDGAVVRTSRSHLYALTASLWKVPSSIPVCWEVAGFPTEKAWVTAAINASWEAAAPHIHFTGWETCTSATERGVHIVVRSGDPDGPHVIDFGQDLDGEQNGMTLDFQFAGGDRPQCLTSEAKRQQCIRAISIHEFGHALGFLHEQTRPDTPSTCLAFLGEPTTPQAADPTKKVLGTWDAMSMMNYCYPGGGLDNVFPTQLSPNDVAGLLAMYPPPATLPNTSNDTADAGVTPTTTTPDPSDSDDTTSATPEHDNTNKRSHKGVGVVSTGCTASGGGSAGSRGGLLICWSVALILIIMRRAGRSLRSLS